MKEPEEETRTDNRYVAKGLRALWQLWGAERPTVLYCVCLLAFGQLLMLGVPTCLKFVFDELPAVMRQGLSTHFVLLLLTMLVLPVLNNVILRYEREPRFFKSLVTVENNLPVLAQAKLLALSREYHDRENTGQKVAKITNSCHRFIDISAEIYWNTLPQLFSLVLGALIMLWLDWRLAVLLYLPFVPMALALKKMFDKGALFWDAWHKDHETSIGLINQSVANVSTVQGYVQERREVAANRVIRNRMAKLDLDTSEENRATWFVTGLVMHLSYALALCYGVVTTVYGSTNVGSLVYLATAGFGSVNTLIGVMLQYTNVVRNLSSIVRLRNLLNEPITVANEAPGVVLPSVAGLIEFNKVGYRYPDKPHAVVEDLNLTVSPGKMLAFVSLSGAGKSTIVKLLTRVYDPDRGEITIDGFNVRSLDRDWYRGLFAVVQQGVDIFDATLRDNIAYGFPGATDQQVWKAVEDAQLAALVSDPKELPLGLLTRVGERGVKLSGGQRQRVGIARAYLALMREAKVLILDEATSELDSESELEIQEMLKKLQAEYPVTIVAIAHRLSTIYRADQIWVVEGGRISESGTHADLLRGNGLYARLVELQALGAVRA